MKHLRIRAFSGVLAMAIGLATLLSSISYGFDGPSPAGSEMSRCAEEECCAALPSPMPLKLSPLQAVPERSLEDLSSLGPAADSDCPAGDLLAAARIFLKYLAFRSSLGTP